MTRDEIMREWFETLSPEEKVIAKRSQRETREYLREREPQPVRFSYGASTPHYKAILETKTKI